MPAEYLLPLIDLCFWCTGWDFKVLNGPKIMFRFCFWKNNGFAKPRPGSKFTEISMLFNLI